MVNRGTSSALIEAVLHAEGVSHVTAQITVRHSLMLCGFGMVKIVSFHRTPAAGESLVQEPLFRVSLVSFSLLHQFASVFLLYFDAASN